MHLRSRLLFVLSIPIVSAIAFACGDDDNAAVPQTDAGADTSTPDTDSAGPTADGSADSGSSTAVALSFGAKVGSMPFSCSSTYSGLGTTQVMVEPRDFRFYVHDVRLVRTDDVEVPVAVTDDGKWQKDGLVLLDFEDGQGSCTGGTADLNDKVLGEAPSGQYKGVHFTVGVPFAMNHQNQATAPSPLNIGQMFWSWNGGYKFLKIDGQPHNADAGPDAGPLRFNVHLGSTGCQGNPADGGAVNACSAPNRAEVKLALSQGTLDFATNKIVLDWAELLGANDLLVNGGGPGGCMSFPGDSDCNTVFQKLGLAYGSGTPSGTQTVFRIE